MVKMVQSKPVRCSLRVQLNNISFANAILFHNREAYWEGINQRSMSDAIKDAALRRAKDAGAELNELRRKVKHQAAALRTLTQELGSSSYQICNLRFLMYPAV
jgi:hypothetical protein